MDYGREFLGDSFDLLPKPQSIYYLDWIAEDFLRSVKDSL